MMKGVAWQQCFPSHPQSSPSPYAVPGGTVSGGNKSIEIINDGEKAASPHHQPTS